MNRGDGVSDVQILVRIQQIVRELPREVDSAYLAAAGFEKLGEAWEALVEAAATL